MATKVLTKTRQVYVRRVGRRAKKTTLSLAVMAGFAPTLAYAYEGFKLNEGKGPDGGMQEAAHRLTMRLTGYEWKGNYWSSELLVQGLGPVLLGMLIHKGANKLGINRMLARAGVPLLRV